MNCKKYPLRTRYSLVKMLKQYHYDVSAFGERFIYCPSCFYKHEVQNTGYCDSCNTLLLDDLHDENDDEQREF